MDSKNKKQSPIARLLFSILLIILGIWSIVMYFQQRDGIMLIPGIVFLLVGLLMLKNSLSKKY